MYTAEARYAIEYEEYRETKQQIWCRVRIGLLKTGENVGASEQGQREQREEQRGPRGRRVKWKNEDINCGEAEKQMSRREIWEISCRVNLLSIVWRSVC